MPDNPRKTRPIIGEDGELIEPIIEGEAPKYRRKPKDESRSAHAPFRPGSALVVVVLLSVIGVSALLGASAANMARPPVPTYSLPRESTPLPPEIRSQLIDCSDLLREADPAALAVFTSFDFPRKFTHYAHGVFLLNEATGSRCQFSVPGGDVFFSDPTLSPDRQHLFVERYDNARQTSELVMISLASDGAASRVIAPISAIGEAGGRWSPDGQWLLTVAVDDSRRRAADNISLLNQVSADGQTVQTLFEYDGLIDAAAWSPSGGQIAFLSNNIRSADENNTIGGINLYVVNSSGDGLRHVLTGGMLPSSVTWSPDEREIGFVAWGGTTFLLRIPADGSGNARPVVRNGAWMECPHWTPKMAEMRYVTDGEENYELRAIDMAGTLPINATEVRVIATADDPALLCPMN